MGIIRTITKKFKKKKIDFEQDVLVLLEKHKIVSKGMLVQRVSIECEAKGIPLVSVDYLIPKR